MKKGGILQLKALDMNCHRLCINGEHILFDFSMEKVAVAGNQILAKGLWLKQPVFLILLQPLAFTILYMYTCTTTQMVSHGL